MGSKKSTSSSSGGGGEGRRGGNPRKVRRRTEKARIKSKVKKGISVVKKKLGVTEMKHGPMGYLQTKKGTKDVLALKLSGTKGGTSMFGSEVSQATNEYLASIGEAKKFWDEINEGSKKQIPTITNLKKGKIFKAIKARLKKSKD